MDEAKELGAVQLGDVERPVRPGPLVSAGRLRPRHRPDIVENRGGESTLGNLVAEVQRWATESETFGAAEIAFMNPGGLRANMAGPTVTYRQAAGVQPFANTLVNMDLTGAQIKTVLEQQWQRDADGNVPTRPFLRLGTSEGSSTPTTRRCPRVPGSPGSGSTTSRSLAGESYSVTVNSFLAAGGDNFREFANGANKADTGQIDLQAMVDYMEEFAADAPLEVDYAQHSVGATVTDDSIELSSLAMTGANDVRGRRGRGVRRRPVAGHLPGGLRAEHRAVRRGRHGHGPPTPSRATARRTCCASSAPRPAPRSWSPSRAARPRANLKVITKPERVVVDRTRAKVITVVKAGGAGRDRPDRGQGR